MFLLCRKPASSASEYGVATEFGLPIGVQRVFGEKAHISSICPQAPRQATFDAC